MGDWKQGILGGQACVRPLDAILRRTGCCVLAILCGGC
jgi:hypothetical protein